ncbi:MAG: hypothetical protein ABI588_08450 [Arenimonas sp.]
MKLAHALVALLAIAAVGWWAAGHPGYETGEQAQARAAAQAQAIEAAKPKLYRWHDAKGALQITDTPPAGRKYELVDVEATAAKLSEVPMSAPPDPEQAAPAR